MATTTDGTVVAWDGDAQALHVLAPGSAEALAVPLRAPGWTGDRLVAIGPDDVAYLFARPTDASPDETLDLLAVAFTGPKAGTVITRAAGVGDPSGDTDYVATAAGIVTVGCCDRAPVRPAPDAAPIMAWVDADGRPATSTATSLTFQYSPGHQTVTRSDSTALFDVTTALAGQDLPGRGMPMLAAAHDGSVLVAAGVFDGTRSYMRVARVRPDGSTELFTGLGDGMRLIGLDASGPIVADDTAIFLWQLPGYGATRSFDPGRELRLTDPYTTADEAVQGALDVLRRNDSCEVPTTAELTGTEERGISVVARYDVRSGCDDSITGAAVAIQFVQADGAWSGQVGVTAPLCTRGVTADGRCV